MLDHLPCVPMPRVLARVDFIWRPEAAPHHLIYGRSGSGKSTLIKQLLGLCPDERVLILDPKQQDDPVWQGIPDDPWQWGRPVTTIEPMFGYRGEPGGGPNHLWYRLTGAPDRDDTQRRFAAALRIMAAEGHTVIVFDDVREICRQLRLAEQVDSVMNLGRSANVCAILSATEFGYVAGRGQAAMTWVGATSGLKAHKDGAAMLGRSGRAWDATTGAIQPHSWIFNESQPGSAGPCLTGAAALPCS